MRLPEDYDKAEFARIKAAAKKIQSDSQALVVIGIGGSYLGARGVIECLRSPNYNLKKKNTPNIYFIGNGLSSDALTEVMELVDGVDFSVNVISKSGTTTEPAVAFRFSVSCWRRSTAGGGCPAHLCHHRRPQRALKSLADDKGYEEFVVPDNIGGRYSVLTAVGLLPIAVAGIDIDALMDGAADMMRECALADMNANPAWQYAGARYELYRTGKKIELLAAYEPASALCPSGGSSSTARARARRTRVCSPPAWSLPLTCTPWASTSRRVSATSSRRWCASARPATSAPCPTTRPTATA